MSFRVLSWSDFPRLLPSSKSQFGPGFVFCVLAVLKTAVRETLCRFGWEQHPTGNTVFSVQPVGDQARPGWENYSALRISTRSFATAPIRIRTAGVWEMANSNSATRKGGSSYCSSSGKLRERGAANHRRESGISPRSWGMMVASKKPTDVQSDAELVALLRQPVLTV